MPIIAQIVLLCWIPLSLLLFWRLPPRRAALIVVLAGWALLPTAHFTERPPPDVLPYWFMPAALPAQYFITKATIIGLAALLGSLCFDLRHLTSLRPRWLDALLLLLCCSPLFPAAAGHSTFDVAARDVAYLLLAWGVPYLLGRLYFPDLASLHEFALAFIITACAYLPICLLEGIFGPFVYALAYGFHPFGNIGETRYIGYRPIGFLEDGNQLGMFLAIAALLAYWLHRCRALPQSTRRLNWALPPLLILATLASQSAGAILLLALGILLLELCARFGARFLIVLLLLATLSFIALRAANIFSVHHFGRDTPLGRLAADWLRHTGRSSLGWRLVQEERHLQAALAHLLTGTGQWNWWQEGQARPWGLCFFILGMYGLSALAAVYTILLLPLALLPRRFPLRFWKVVEPAAPVLAIALALTAIDSLLNSAVLLPLLLAISPLILPPNVLKPSQAPQKNPKPNETIILLTPRIPHDSSCQKAQLLI